MGTPQPGRALGRAAGGTVAIARAMVIEPPFLMADEPTGNLDSLTSREIMDLLGEFNRNLGITVLMVTHDKTMASYAGRTINFFDGLIETVEFGGGKSA